MELLKRVTTFHESSPAHAKPQVTPSKHKIYTRLLKSKHIDEEFSSLFDFVAVFPVAEDGTQTPVCKHCIAAFLRAKFDVFVYLSVQEDEIYVLLKCPKEIVRSFADKVDYQMELDPKVIKCLIEGGNFKKRINGVKIAHMPEISRLTPYQYIYGMYKEDLHIYKTHGEGENKRVFFGATKLKLVYALVEGPTRIGGCGLPINRLIKQGSLLGFFPLHEKAWALDIKKNMTKCCAFPWKMPFNDIKDYFGEKVALYFHFLGTLSLFLSFPATIGLFLQLYIWYTGEYDSPYLIIFSCMISVWCILLMEYWKRKEQRIAMKWGMSNFEDTELERPEFIGSLINSYINGRELKFYPPTKKANRECHSRVIMVLLVFLILGALGSIYTLRFYLQASGTDLAVYASMIASVLNSTQIVVFNAVYNEVSLWLTKYENHRTDTEYEDAMITKLFTFQFINSFSSFFFIAFVAQNVSKAPGSTDGSVGQCGFSTCMIPLGLNVGVIFFARLTAQNFAEILLPWMAFRSKRNKETQGIEIDKMTKPEWDYLLLRYDIMIESITDYADSAIMFGYMTLFVTALPIACMLALVGNIIKCKVSAYKMFNYCQRPIPKAAQDIGNWQDIFGFMGTVAVITNGGLIFFTMDTLWFLPLAYRVWLFIGFQWILITTQVLLEGWIDDIPQDVIIQAQRQEFICSKLIDELADEEFNPKGYRPVASTGRPEDEGSRLIRDLLGESGQVPDYNVGAYPEIGEEWPEVMFTARPGVGVGDTAHDDSESEEDGDDQPMELDVDDIMGTLNDDDDGSPLQSPDSSHKPAHQRYQQQQAQAQAEAMKAPLPGVYDPPGTHSLSAGKTFRDASGNLRLDLYMEQKQGHEQEEEEGAEEDYQSPPLTAQNLNQLGPKRLSKQKSMEIAREFHKEVGQSTSPVAPVYHAARKASAALELVRRTQEDHPEITSPKSKYAPSASLSRSPTMKGHATATAAAAGGAPRIIRKKTRPKNTE